MSSSRLTFGAMLSTVTTTANTVTATLEAVNQGVGMLTSYVGNAAEHQKLRQLADNETFVEELIREKSFEETQSTLRVSKFISQSDEHHSAYEKAYNKFNAILRKQSTETQPKD